MANGIKDRALFLATAVGASILGGVLAIHFAIAKTAEGRGGRVQHSNVPQGASATTASAKPLPDSTQQQNTAWSGVGTRDFELRDWFAFGSGCRSRPTLPGDVSLQVKEAAQGSARVEVTLNDFGILPGEPIARTVPSFARECGIRLAVHPAVGKRLRAVSVAPVYRVDKPVGSRVRLRGRLLVGDATLARFEKWFEEAETVRDQQLPVDWSSDVGAQTLFHGLSCEQPKIVGLDISAAVVRAKASPSEVAISMHRRSVEILLEFEDCNAIDSTQQKEQKKMPKKQHSEEEAP